MNLLAVDTSTEACSCALWIEGACCEIFELAPRRHGELLLGMVERLLADAEIARSALDVLAFGRGPGSFTGVRIATGMVQGIAFALDVPVAPVSSLQALAQGVSRELQRDSVLAGLDARMQEVYWGVYRMAPEGVTEPLLAESVCPPESAPIPHDGEWFGAGSAWSSYRDTLVDAVGDRLADFDAERYPHAQDVAVIGAAAASQGRLVTADKALPVYLRDTVTRGKASGNP